jgi:hypothetical protein
VEALWSYPGSPWYQRINMLGEKGLGQMVTQAGWIKSLMATYIKGWEGKGVKGGIGGLFGAPTGTDMEALPWSRVQQAAFLIFVWQCMQKSVLQCKDLWAEDLRKGQQINLLQEDFDPAFHGPDHTNLNTLIGARGFLYITNDFCYIQSDILGLKDWVINEYSDSFEENHIKQALDSLKKETKIVEFLENLTFVLAKYDWRSSSAPNLSRNEQMLKSAIRGGAGYKEIRVQLLEHLQNESSIIGQIAKKINQALGY